MTHQGSANRVYQAQRDQIELCKARGGACVGKMILVQEPYNSVCPRLHQEEMELSRVRPS